MGNHTVLLGVGLLVINPSGEILLLRELISKPQNGKLAGMLTMPLETIESQETPDQALLRMIEEEVGVPIKAELTHFNDFLIELTDTHSVRLYVYLGFCDGDFVAKPKDNDIEYFGWMKPEEVIELDSIYRRIEVEPILRSYLER